MARKQIVVIDGVKSNEVKVEAGVPQGRRLGLLLFIIYSNNTLRRESANGSIGRAPSRGPAGLDPCCGEQLLGKRLNFVTINK